MGSSAPIRIAILEADNPPPQTMRKYGSYGGLFTSLLHRGADASNIPRSELELSGWDVCHIFDEDWAAKGEIEEDVGGIYNWKRRREYPSLDEVDAILITGSKYNSFDNDPWILRLVEFTQQALIHPRVRVIGVCYGHQIVGRAMGAKVARNDGDGGGWEISVCEVQQTGRGREFYGGKSILNINQMHKDIVCEWPSGVERLGSSPVCDVQAMYIPKKLITVQGHPEFDEEIMKELLVMRHRQGIFDDELYADAERRRELRHDGVAVAQGFLKMLME